MSRRVLVTGASGLLGRQVWGVFTRRDWAVTGTALSRADGKTLVKLDLEDAAEVERVIDETRPDVVIHCAANRFPDKVDGDPEGTQRLNVEASRTLAQLCVARNATLIYISTDYVFSGKPGEAPYEADAVPAPTNLYGQTKLDGERAVLEAYDVARTEATKKGRGVVLRVPLLYGPTRKNEESAVNVLLDIVDKVEAERGEGKMDHWAIRYPTNTEDVARVLADIATKYVDAGADVTLPPILQFSSEDRYTKYEMCQLFAEILGISIKRIVPDTTGGNGGPVQRPYDCHLSTKLLKDLGIAVHTQNFQAWWRWQTKAYRH